MRDTGNLRINPEAQFPNFGITGIACLDRPDLKLRTRGVTGRRCLTELHTLNLSALCEDVI